MALADVERNASKPFIQLYATTNYNHTPSWHLLLRPRPIQLPFKLHYIWPYAQLLLAFPCQPAATSAHAAQHVSVLSCV